VRESIAKGIETAYNDASEKHDNANMEVKLARGTNPNLNTRLNKMDEVDKQTATQMAEKVGGGKLATLNDLDEETLNFIHDGTGGPVSIESVPKDFSVTPTKTDFIVKETTLIGDNILNPDEFEHGGYYRISNGEWIDDPNYVTSGLIRVEKVPIQYYGKNVSDVYIYRADGSYIGKGYVEKFGFEANDEEIYIRARMLASEVNKATIEAHDENEVPDGYSPEYTPYEAKHTYFFKDGLISR